MTDDLARWLLEQIAERERTLHAAGGGKLGWATYRKPDGSVGYTAPVAASGDVWIADGKLTQPDAVLVVVSTGTTSGASSASIQTANLSQTRATGRARP